MANNAKSRSAPGLVRDINSHVVICLPLMVVRLSGVTMLGILGFVLYHLSHLHVHLTQFMVDLITLRLRLL